MEWNEVRELLSSTPAENAWFGTGVALGGDFAVVGGPLESADRGAAHLFQRDEGGPAAWGHRVRLTASNASAYDEFGSAVDISGDTVIVGAPGYDGTSSDGAAYLYERDEGGTDTWGEVIQLLPPDSGAFRRIGLGVAIDGDIAAMGGGSNTSAGAAYIFLRSLGGPDAWGLANHITASSGTLLGNDIDIDGETVVIGVAGLETAHVYQRNAGGPDAFGLVTQLVPSDGGIQDDFGTGVAVSGDLAAVGAPNNGLEIDNTPKGAVFLFERNQGGPDGWGEIHKIVASDGQQGDDFGTTVSLSGDRLIVGGTWTDGVYVYERDHGGADAWGEVTKLTRGQGLRFGRTVDLDGDQLISGATFVDGGASHAGAAYLYALQGTEGEACTDGTECVTGYCADGMCCDSPCGGGALDDCEVCSVAAGASADGVCTPLPDGNACAGGTCEGGQCVGSGTGGSGAGSASGGSAAGGASPGNGDDPSSEDDGGCGCRTAGTGAAQLAPIGWLLMLGLLPYGRRRRPTG